MDICRDRGEKQKKRERHREGDTEDDIYTVIDRERKEERRRIQ